MTRHLLLALGQRLDENRGLTRSGCRSRELAGARGGGEQAPVGVSQPDTATLAWAAVLGASSRSQMIARSRERGLLAE